MLIAVFTCAIGLGVVAVNGGLLTLAATQLIPTDSIMQPLGYHVEPKYGPHALTPEVDIEGSKPALNVFDEGTACAHWQGI